MQLLDTVNARRIKRRDLLFVLVTSLVTIAFYLAGGVSAVRGNADSDTSSTRARGRVTQVDNSMVKIIGPVKQGEQQLEVKVLSGKFKGAEYTTTNNLAGKLELDKLYAKGDTVLLVLDLAENGTVVAYANTIDHYRTGKTILLAVLFASFLVLISGWVGVKVLVSVAFSGTTIVCVLLPAILRGWDPIIATLLVTGTLTAVIVFLVGGLTRTGLSAFAGAMGGVVATTALATGFTYWLKLHGAVRPFAETLLYSGYGHLNLAHLFISGIFLASSGAVMDLAMDIAVAMAEVKEQQPSLTRRALISSGFTISRHVTGTMVTTLVLAYSAEYTAMLMTFIAQGVPFENIINMVYVSSEIVHTLVGCFGLVLVAPLTVVCGGFILGAPRTTATR